MFDAIAAHFGVDHHTAAKALRRFGGNSELLLACAGFVLVQRPSTVPSLKPATPGTGTGRSPIRRSGQQIVDGDPCVGARERRDAVARCMYGDAAVAVFTRIAVNLKTGIGDGEDPVVRNSRSRIQALLDGPVVLQRLVRHLDDEQCRRRLCVPTVIANCTSPQRAVGVD